MYVTLGQIQHIFLEGVSFAFAFFVSNQLMHISESLGPNLQGLSFFSGKWTWKCQSSHHVFLSFLSRPYVLRLFDMFFSRWFFGTSGRLFQDSLQTFFVACGHAWHFADACCIPASMRCLQAKMDLPKTNLLALDHLFIHKDLAGGVF